MSGKPCNPEVYATRQGVKHARRLGLISAAESGEELSALVRAMICEGSLARDRTVPTGRVFLVFDDGWQAQVEKKPSEIRPRGNYWSVLRVEARSGGKITPRPRSSVQPSARRVGSLVAAGVDLEARIAELLERTG